MHRYEMETTLRWYNPEHTLPAPDSEVFAVTLYAGIRGVYYAHEFLIDLQRAGKVLLWAYVPTSVSEHASREFAARIASANAEGEGAEL